MKSPELASYQQTGKELLERTMPPGVEVKTEWATMVGELRMYSPRLDIAVGPFATIRRYIQEYDDLMERNRTFIEALIETHNSNLREFGLPTRFPDFEEIKHKNQNARCFLAIEIENRVSRKHLMGGAINAAALGRIGIVVAWTPDKLKAFLQLRRYLEFLDSVGKNTFDTTNLLIMDKDQLLRILRIHSHRNRRSAGGLPEKGAGEVKPVVLGGRRILGEA